MKFAAEGLLHELERPDCVSGARGADRHVSAVHEEYAGLREPNGFRVREEEEKRPRNARRNPHRCQFHIKWPVFQYEIIIFRGNSPLFFSEIMNFAFKMMNDFLHYCLLHYCLLHYYLLYYYLLHYYILHYCLLYHYILYYGIVFCITIPCRESRPATDGPSQNSRLGLKPSRTVSDFTTVPVLQQKMR